MATAITLGHGGTPASINLNNQSTHFVGESGFNYGGPQTTWDEAISYSGGASTQVNVQRKHLIPVTIPMWVVGSSVSNLNTLLSTLWTLVDTCTNAAPGTLQVASETAMNIVYSTRPEDLERNTVYELQFRAYFTLVLMRQP